ncbi:hypothetical protein BT93_H3699 [Corymbia citriodora subsp. variegata]|nr:hypothetical protein BT93_H3699 [Corymbia citriodora subsp. variegata]
MRLTKLCFCIADPRDGEDKHEELPRKPRHPKAGRGDKSRGLVGVGVATAPNEQEGSHGQESGNNDGSAAALMVAAAYASSTLLATEGGSSHGHGGDGGDGGSCDGCGGDGGG